MTIFGTLGTLLATIPGMTLGTNVITAENPRLTAQEALPCLNVHRIGNLGEFTLEGVRYWTQDRFQVTMSAATHAGLLVLNGQVQGKLDNTTGVGYIRSIPLGGTYREGHEDNPEAFSNMSDWLIMY
jgi:hypothetical protein